MAGIRPDTSAKAGHQRYRCHDCRRTFGNPQEQADSRAQREQLQAHALAAYQERASMRGVCRIFGVGRNTLSGWLKTEILKSLPVAAAHGDAGPGPTR